MTPSPAERRPGFEDLRQAAEWFAALQDETATDADRQGWQRWLDRGPLQRAAWQRVQAVAGEIDSLAQLPARQALEGKARLDKGRRRALLRTLAVLPVTGLAAWFAARRLPWSGWTAAQLTGVGERRELLLADGSRLWLNTDSAADVDFTPALRRVLLFSGELLLTTAPDPVQPARPLEVHTAHGRMRALGTRFSVRHEEAGAVRLTVYQGAVQATPASGPPRTVQAGEQARMRRDGVESLGPAPLHGDGWTRGVLVADHLRLGDVVAELARYRHGVLACADAVADLRVVGAYPLADIDRVLDALQATLPVRVLRPMPWWVMVDAAPRAGVR